MAYNMTALDNANTFSDIFIGLNNVLNGTLIMVFMLAFFILLMVGFKRYETSIGLIASGTILTLIFIPLISAGLMFYSYIIFPIAVLLAGMVYKGLGK
jgi:hypothetical protein